MKRHFIISLILATTSVVVLMSCTNVGKSTAVHKQKEESVQMVETVEKDSTFSIVGTWVYFFPNEDQKRPEVTFEEDGNMTIGTKPYTYTYDDSLGLLKTNSADGKGQEILVKREGDSVLLFLELSTSVNGRRFGLKRKEE